uniref:Sodium/potassium-transporting ATPase subunit beta n=1 Tax=Geotrypetes seraphini TaxID=260995 RepID=A0A6P8RFY8_GEOSA|nr:protein ATP1B4 isoform X2 [Geotrypetes seraphini]
MQPVRPPRKAKSAMENNSTSAVAIDHQANDLYKPGKNDEERREESDEESEEGKQGVTKKTWAERKQEIKTFIWNPEKGEFMGRTAQSWGLILLFYLFFYAFLAGMFSFCMYVMLLTISPYAPTQRDRVTPPGVMIRPYTSGFHFTFNASEISTWSSYVESMHNFLEAYNDSVQAVKNVKCTPGSYFMQEGAVMEEKKACQFNRSLLENCSGIEDPTFGYSEGKPCLFLKMNRIIGYRPGLGIPVSVSCEVQKSDESDLKAVNFYPGNGTFDLMYFPFYGKLTHPNYTSPLVALQFTDVRKNHPVGIQCKLHGKGIVNDYNNDRFLGRVFLTVNIGV